MYELALFFSGVGMSMLLTNAVWCWVHQRDIAVARQAGRLEGLAAAFEDEDELDGAGEGHPVLRLVRPEPDRLRMVMRRFGLVHPADGDEPPGVA